MPSLPEEVAEVAAAEVEGPAGSIVVTHHLHNQPQPAAAVAPRQLAALGRQRHPAASAALPAWPRGSTQLRLQIQPQRRHPLQPQMQPPPMQQPPRPHPLPHCPPPLPSPPAAPAASASAAGSSSVSDSSSATWSFSGCCHCCCLRRYCCYRRQQRYHQVHSLSLLAAAATIAIAAIDVRRQDETRTRTPRRNRRCSRSCRRRCRARRSSPSWLAVQCPSCCAVGGQTNTMN